MLDDPLKLPRGFRSFVARAVEGPQGPAIHGSTIVGWQDISTVRAGKLPVGAAFVASGTVGVSPGQTFVPPGAVFPFAGSAAPTGFLICDGASVLRATYPDLFAVIGTTYGSVDGTHFTLPNLKGRVVAGVDAGQAEFDVLGETGGEKTHVITTAEMPSHTHTQNSHSHSHSHSLQTNGGVFLRDWTTATAGGTQNTVQAQGANPIAQTDTDATTATATNQNAGGDGAHNNLQPYMALNYVIKT